MRDRDEALERAIEKAGSSQKLAEAISITPQALSQWASVPALRVLAVEAATGISRHELRPDIYGAAPSATPAATVQGAAA